MQCPHCSTQLRLVAEHSVNPEHSHSGSSKRFQILDLLGLMALVGVHLSAFPVIASPSNAEWPSLLYLTPTGLTCLIHYRLRLQIPMAMVVHYSTTLIWTYLHSIGQNAAINAYNTANPSPLREYQLPLLSNAWSDTIAMTLWSIVFTATYGLVCYTAIKANRFPPSKTGQPNDLECRQAT